MKRALVLAALGCLVAVPAGAHPVPIGRYAQIPYGVSPAHPHPTTPRRKGLRCDDLV